MFTVLANLCFEHYDSCSSHSFPHCSQVQDNVEGNVIVDFSSKFFEVLRDPTRSCCTIILFSPYCLLIFRSQLAICHSEKEVETMLTYVPFTMT